MSGIFHQRAQEKLHPEGVGQQNGFQKITNLAFMMAPRCHFQYFLMVTTQYMALGRLIGSVSLPLLAALGYILTMQKYSLILRCCMVWKIRL